MEKHVLLQSIAGAIVTMRKDLEKGDPPKYIFRNYQEESEPEYRSRINLRKRHKADFLSYCLDWYLRIAGHEFKGEI